MEFYEREFLLSKILFGSTIIDINEDLTVHVNPLTIKQNLFAQRVFKKTYEEALLSGVFTRKEMLELMKEQGLWSEEHEDAITKVQKEIEDLKVSLYENFHLLTGREAFRVEIREKEKEQIKLFEKKHNNDHLDCEGIATYSRLNWVIENTTTYEDGTPYLFDEFGITVVLQLKNNQEIDHDEYRELARTDPWRSLWSNSGKDPEKAFQRLAFDLTQTQKSLVDWSRLYDNVAEAYESPDDKIVEDNDALDGWLLSEQRKADRERNQQKLDGLQNAHQNADEVFLMAPTQKEAQEVYDLNDMEGQYVVASRKERLKKKKNIHYHEFKDVQIRAMNEANAKYG